MVELLVVTARISYYGVSIGLKLFMQNLTHLCMGLSCIKWNSHSYKLDSNT